MTARKLKAAPGSGSLKVEWKCPRCGASVRDHGKGGAEECKNYGGSCGGFICDCDDFIDDDDHGLTFEKPCEFATCLHCDWHGKFPEKPKGLAPWEKKALDAGWTPPDRRRKELGL